MDKHKIIRQLRVKADSTTFPAEAQALRDRANKLEAKYGAKEPDTSYPFRVQRIRQADPQKAWDDMMNWRQTGGRPAGWTAQQEAAQQGAYSPYNPPQPPPVNISMADINEMLNSMHAGRPMTGGVLIVNGKVIGTVDGFGPITGNFTQTNNDATTHVNFDAGASE
jgi:hypothetical protein